MDKMIYIIVGSVVGIVVLLILICCCCKKKKTKDSEPKNNDHRPTVDDSNDNQEMEFSTTGERQGNSATSAICNIEDTAQHYRVGSYSKDGLQTDRKFSGISNNKGPEDTANGDVSALQVNPEAGNFSAQFLSHQPNDVTYFPAFPRDFEQSESTKVKSDLYDGTTRKDSRFCSLVSSEVRDELNIILRQDSIKSPELVSNDSPTHVYPSQLKEYSSSFIKHEVHEEKKTKPELGTPRIPQPDYGMPASPVPLPYKRREFKGPYGAEDLDDMNNPYTIKRGKQKRPSIH